MLVDVEGDLAFDLKHTCIKGKEFDVPEQFVWSSNYIVTVWLGKHIVVRHKWMRICESEKESKKTSGLIYSLWAWYIEYFTAHALECRYLLFKLVSQIKAVVSDK